MRYCTFKVAGEPAPGRLEGDEVVRLAAPSLVDVLAADTPPADGERYPLTAVTLLAPIPRPPSIRDFFAFEQHVATARANRGSQVPAEWYEFPVFYFANPAAVYGPADDIPYPAGTAELDYELEVAAVIGRDGTIAGFTAMNDWSARDIRPTRDQQVHAGDWTVTIGTVDETADRGIKVHQPTGTRARRPRLRRALDAVRVVLNDFNPAFYPALTAAGILLATSMIVLHYNYQRPRMSWIDALYFTVETITTTGYGDFSFGHQVIWLRLFAAMLMFSGATTIALLVAFIADVLLSQRFVVAAARPRVRHLRNHIIVVGLSELGIRVVTDLINTGHDVAVIERDEENRFLSMAQELDVPVIFGDATLLQTLESARVDRARAVAVVTRDDMVNIETGIVLAEMLGPRVLPEVNRRAEVPLVLRVYDRTLGFAVAQRFGFDNVRSSVELAAPWFIGAASGLAVLGTFSVGQSSFMVGAMRVAPGSDLDGLQISDLSTQIRVIAFDRQDDAPPQLRPRRDHRLCAGDTVYLVGPYRELLGTLRRGLPPRQPATDEELSRDGHDARPDKKAQEADVSREARAG